MPTDPIGAVVRNLFAIQRLSNGVAQEANALILDLFDDIAAQIARIDPTAPQAERWRRERVEKLLGVVDGLAEETFTDVHRVARQRLAEIGAQQGEWAGAQLARTLSGVGADIRPGRVGVNLMKSVLDTDPIQGFLLKDWFAGQQAAVVRKVRQQVQIGMAQNETIDDMVRRIRGRSAGILRGRDGKPLRTRDGGFVHRYTGGVMETTTREATAIARTAVNHIANVAHVRTYQENADVLSGVRWTATLDARTCEICGGLDGKVWKLDDPDRRQPPAHVNDRCVLVPVVDWKGLGIEPPESSTRASADGPVSSDVTYSEWLKKQSREVQDEILGPGRAALFRDGKVTLAQMVRGDGSIVTVRELRGERGVLRDLGAAGSDVLEAGRSKVMPQVLADEKAIVGKRFEYARAWDPETGERVLFGGTWKTGPNQIEKTIGDPKRIEFSPNEIDRLKGKIVTHNHPSGAPFSPSDLRMAGESNMYEIRAVGKVNTFSAVRPAGGWDAGALENAVAAFERDWRDLRRDQQTTKAAHELWRTHLSSIGVRYTVTRTPA